MAVHIVGSAGAAIEDLWRVSLHDAAFVALAAPPSDRRDAFVPILAEALRQTGRVQPTPVPQRATTRGDAGRVQVALAESHMDVVLLFAGRLRGHDLGVLDTITRRAGSDLWLVYEGEPEMEHLDAVGLQPMPLTDPDVALTSWLSRPTVGARDPGRCLDSVLGSSLSLDARCSSHSDVAGCLRQAAGPAMALGLADERLVATRMHQVMSLDETMRWKLAGRARDTATLANAAIGHLGISPHGRRQLRLRDCNSNGSVIRVHDRDPVPVPAQFRESVRLHRAIRIADGFQAHHQLLRVSEATITQYLSRAGVVRASQEPSQRRGSP